MSRTIALVSALVSLLASGCGLWLPMTPREPPIVEDIFHDARARVRMTALDQGGFPDRVVEYHVVVEEIGGGSTELLTGRAQVQSIQGHARATRLASSALAVALGDQLYVVGHGARCFDLASSAAPASVEALTWRAADPESRPEDRTRAAIALAWIDPAATEPLGPSTGYLDLDAELRGTRARLTGDAALIEALRTELGGFSAMRVAGLARACVPELDADVRSERARMSPSSALLIDQALGTCALRTRARR